jgi:hypothetical protein
VQLRVLLQQVHQARHLPGVSNWQQRANINSNVWQVDLFAV